MKNVTYELRKAYVTVIGTGLKLQNKVVPVCEEYLNTTPARVTIGNATVDVYVIILNQTSNNDSNVKCRRDDQSSIQVQVTTVFPPNSGGSQTAELLSDTIRASLFQGSQLNSSLTLPEPFRLWKANLEGARNINYQTETNRVWIHQMTFNNYISQV